MATESFCISIVVYEQEYTLRSDISVWHKRFCEVQENIKVNEYCGCP